MKSDRVILQNMHKKNREEVKNFLPILICLETGIIRNTDSV